MADKLSNLLTEGSDRLVVLDTETTGLGTNDRVVEMAIVTLSADGEVWETWDSLIQPCRDVSCTHIHGITASMVADAPTFEDLAGDVAIRLHGATVVAHNLTFDQRMLNNEFARVGEPDIVTSGICTLRATKMRLSAACASYGVALPNAHRARDDALATAQLLQAVAPDCKPGSPISAPLGLRRTGRVLRREDTEPVVLPEPPAILNQAWLLAFNGVELGLLLYLDMLARSLEDIHLDKTERAGLQLLAERLKLSETHVAQAHRRFVNELIDVALDDNLLTPTEYDVLLRVGSALDVDPKRIEARLRPFQEQTSTTLLEPGMNVVFTGEHSSYTRDDLSAHAKKIGLKTQNTVTKTTNLLASADTETYSSKAVKARRYRIPVVSVDDFIRAAPGENIVSTMTQKSLKVVTCPDCLATWTVDAASSRSTSKRCEDCVQVKAAEPDTSQVPSAVEVEKSLNDRRHLRSIVLLAAQSSKHLTHNSS